MSGVMTVTRYKALNASSGLTDAQIAYGLEVAQAIAESLSGLIFGSEVTAVAAPVGLSYQLTVSGGIYEVGQDVRLLGGGVSSALFTITDTGIGWIKVDSAVPIAPTKVLPMLEHVGDAYSGNVYVDKRPLFSLLSVKSKPSASSMWSDTSVTTLASTSYEVFKSRGINAGVHVAQDAIPLVAEGGQYLVKRLVRQLSDGLKITYVAGFYSQIPADLESAIVQLVASIVGASAGGGVFSSESHDYYSYSLLSYDQLAMLPFAAVRVLQSYARR